MMAHSNRESLRVAKHLFIVEPLQRFWLWNVYYLLYLPVCERGRGIVLGFFIWLLITSLS